MPSIIEVDTIKNKTGTQNTVLSTDGSGNNTLNAGVIKSNTGSNTGLTIASDGQVTINQNNPTITLGSNATFPAGHILQVIQSSKSDTANRSYPAFNDIPGTDQGGSGSVWCVKITPSANSSKIIFIASIMVGAENGNASAKIKLLRDSTDLALGNAVSSNAQATYGSFGTQALDMRSMSMTYLDSPSSTSELTYKPQYRSESTDYTTWINRPDSLTGASSNGYTCFSNLIVMEVAG